MNSPNTIFLKPGDTVNVEGVEITYDEIKENKIDSIVLREHLQELQSQ